MAEHAKWFKGANVTIIPDNDAQARKPDGSLRFHSDGRPVFPGQDHAQSVGGMLKGIAESVEILELPGVPVSGSVDDWIPAGGTAEKLFRLRREIARPWKPLPPFSKFGAVQFKNLSDPGPKVEPLIKGILTQNEISLLVGESQSGKSFVAVDIAMAVARGVKFNDRRVSRGAVVYQAGESAAGLRRRRLPAYALHNGCDDQDLPLILLQSQIDLFNSDADAENLASEALEWAAYRDEPLRLIVIDTFNRATPGANENDGRDMGAIIERCEYIRRKTGAHVMLVHHMNAGGTKARGHTSLFAAVDSTIHVRKVEDMFDSNGRQVREWSISKMKEGEDGVSCKFVLPQVVLGHDEDGDEITSCVVSPPIGAEEAATQGDGAVRVSGTNMQVLRAIHEVINDRGRPAPSMLGLPDSVRVVDKKDVSAHLKAVMNDPSAIADRPKGTSEEDARARHLDANRKAATRARDHLHGKGIIGMSEDLVWLTGKPVMGFARPNGRRAAIDNDHADGPGDQPPVSNDLPFDVEEFH
ncbi:AAA family ATPase [Loktanella sp. 3ANDIMAR09]|uniref:AAA family ATPase n=1 Tax=Loktanella sp. 3ANDIMAR09 TaxID=1225657 RepID=UPI00346060AC